MNFKIASASIIGKSHYNFLYNNQDAIGFYKDESTIIGVVADGCGSGMNSEIGSKLAVDQKQILADDTSLIMLKKDED